MTKGTYKKLKDLRENANGISSSPWHISTYLWNSCTKKLPYIPFRSDFIWQPASTYWSVRLGRFILHAHPTIDVPFDVDLYVAPPPPSSSSSSSSYSSFSTSRRPNQPLQVSHTFTRISSLILKHLSARRP